MLMSAAAHAKPRTGTSLNKRERLKEIIKEKSLIHGTFKLASGATSDFYLDMKPTTFDPEGSSLIADIVVELLQEFPEIDAIGGLELGAVPIIAAVSQRSWPERPIPSFVVRKEKKGHGTDKKIDGNFQKNTHVILIDDVTTKGGSVMQAVHAVREQGCTVNTIITIVDRLEGAEQNLRAEGIRLVPVFTKRDLLG